MYVWTVTASLLWWDVQPQAIYLNKHGYCTTVRAEDEAKHQMEPNLILYWKVSLSASGLLVDKFNYAEFWVTSDIYNYPCMYNIADVRVGVLGPSGWCVLCYGKVM